MPDRYVCLICHHEIPNPDAECPHCKSRLSATVGATPQLLAAVFGVMVLLFVVTGFYTGSFRAEMRERAQLHLGMAKTLADYGYYEEAAEQYRDALSYARDNVDYRLGLALALYRLDRHGEAKNHLIELQTSDPTRGVVNELLARLAVENEEHDEAIAYYRTAVHGRWPQDPVQNRIRLQFELIEMLQQADRNMQAVAELLNLLEQVPDDAGVKARAGRHLLGAGAPRRASEVFQELIRIDPGQAEYYAGRGEAEFALGNYLTARTQFRQSLRIDRENDEVRQLLELCDEINVLDPTFRGIGSATRYRRSRELVERALNLVEYCLNPLGPDLAGPPAPLPESVAPAVTQARDLSGGKTRQRRSDENTEANILLAEALWSSHQQLCTDSDRTDEPLRHVLTKLSR